MKKIVLMAAFMVASIAASAQVYVGGSLGLESLKANKDAKTTTSFSIQPEIGYNLDPHTNKVIVTSCIDNLTKGASGQAVQCMNIRFGLDEAEGLI